MDRYRLVGYWYCFRLSVVGTHDNNGLYRHRPNTPNTPTQPKT